MYMLRARVRYGCTMTCMHDDMHAREGFRDPPYLSCIVCYTLFFCSTAVLCGLPITTTVTITSVKHSSEIHPSNPPSQHAYMPDHDALLLLAHQPGSPILGVHVTPCAAADRCGVRDAAEAARGRTAHCRRQPVQTQNVDSANQSAIY